MAQRAKDRRILNTRTVLQRALASLIHRKRYEAITVRDICRVANVGRSTFYAHFRSKDDVKRSGLENMHKSLLDKQQAEPQPERDGTLGFIFGILEHARDHLDHYRVLAGDRGRTVVLAKLRQVIADLVERELRAQVGNSPRSIIDRELAVQYVVGGYMAVLTWWLDRGAKLPVEDIDVACRRFVTDGAFRRGSS